jgi:hypothetical protein
MARASAISSSSGVLDFSGVGAPAIAGTGAVEVGASSRCGVARHIHSASSASTAPAIHADIERGSFQRRIGEASASAAARSTTRSPICARSCA